MAASRLFSLSGLLARGVNASSSLGAFQGSLSLEATAAGRALGNLLGVSGRGMHSSSAISQAAGVAKAGGALSTEPARKYRQLDDKEMWHESWMYEDKFGTEDDPIIVPSLEAERIIGVTDPEDDNLVVWGILRENEPPRQFIEGGEFYVLRTVSYVKKVGDVLEELEKNPSLAK